MLRVLLAFSLVLVLPAFQAPALTPTPDQLAALAGILLSLGFSYVPRLREWYEPLDPQRKRLVMLGLLVAAAAGALAYQCRGAAACYQAGLEPALTAFVAAVLANQATYLLAPKPAARVV